MDTDEHRCGKFLQKPNDGNDPEKAGHLTGGSGVSRVQIKTFRALMDREEKRKARMRKRGGGTGAETFQPRMDADEHGYSGRKKVIRYSPS